MDDSTPILFVDDDQNILNAYDRQFSDCFAITTAQSAEVALHRIQTGPKFAVVVSDNRMPGMDGIEFLSKVREISPSTVRVMLTGYADLQTTIDAVNEGHIFRFLSKPCSADKMEKSLRSAIEQYQLVIAEQQLLEETLRGSIRVMTEVLSLVNPIAFGRAQRIKRIVTEIADELEYQDRWQLDVAAMLSQLGHVVVPEQLLQRAQTGQPLSQQEQQIIRNQREVSVKLLEHIPRLGPVVELIRDLNNSHQQSDNSHTQLASHILKVSSAFDDALSRGMRPEAAIQSIKAKFQAQASRVVAALSKRLAQICPIDQRQVAWNRLNDGMILAADVHSKAGQLLIAKGQDVTESLRSRLRNLLDSSLISEPFHIYA